MATYDENVQRKWPCPPGHREINAADKVVWDRTKMTRGVECRGDAGDGTGRVKIYDPETMLESIEWPIWFVTRKNPDRHVKLYTRGVLSYVETRYNMVADGFTDEEIISAIGTPEEDAEARKAL